MKKLQEEFQSNADQCGLHTFKQVKRCSNAAIYQRIRKDGTTHSFEAFRVKVVKAGAKLPNGTLVQEDYESYPGKSAFGRHAYSCKTIAQAEMRYDEVIKNQEPIDTSVDEEGDDSTSGVKTKPDTKTNATKGTRGRKAIDRSTIRMPKKGEKFEVKGLHLMNLEVSFGFIYQHLRLLLSTGQVKVFDSVSGGRGKPRLIYQMV